MAVSAGDRKGDRVLLDTGANRTLASPKLNGYLGGFCSGGLPSPAKLVTAEVKISIVIFLFAYLPRNTA